MITDFRLSVFISVARHLNFTKAAKELYVSQPAISKHIQELETAYNTQLFERTGGISLTPAGEVFLKHAESITAAYKALQLEMNLLSGNFRGALRIGASTTIAQYVITPIIARFISRFPDIRLTMLTGNSEQIELALKENQIDLGLVEGHKHSRNFQYDLFSKDELVLVTHIQNKVKDEISIEELFRLPLVLRELGSGTLEVIEKSLQTHGLRLSQMNVLLHLGSTESIKSFLQNCSWSYAIISIAAVQNELAGDKLQVIEINGLALEREFSFIRQTGNHNEIAELFMNFAITGITISYNQ